MGVLNKLIGVVLFLYFLLVSIIAPVSDALTILPSNLLPTFLLDLKDWFVKEFDDYLFAEKPPFYVGIIWVELLFQWPIALSCVYGFAASKSWFNTTSLMYGVSSFTCVVTILAEVTGSKRASAKLLIIYLLPLVFSIIAILRGLLSDSGKYASIGRTPVLNQKKMTKNL